MADHWTWKNGGHWWPSQQLHWWWSDGNESVIKINSKRRKKERKWGAQGYASISGIPYSHKQVYQCHSGGQRSLTPSLWGQILGQRGSFSLADTERIFRVSKKPKRKMTWVPGITSCLLWQRDPRQRHRTHGTILRKGHIISYRPGG